MSGLAELYAVGVVGAIATNLGATSTDRKLRLKVWERSFMFATCLVMVAIEISLLVDKPSARSFAATLLAIGLVLRGLASERAQRKKLAAAAAAIPEQPESSPTGQPTDLGLPLLCAVRGIGKTLDFAIEEARATRQPLYVLFVREQPVLTGEDRQRKWQQDEEARRIFGYAKEKAKTHPVLPCYMVSDSPADTIVEVAATIGASRVILGSPQRHALINVLRGNLIRRVSRLMPDSIHLLVYA
jgi:nucleotide-binding universal stress UspA family protein